MKIAFNFHKDSLEIELSLVNKYDESAPSTPCRYAAPKISLGGS